MKILVVASAICLLLIGSGCQNGDHTGVAEWDTDDHPSPESSGAHLPEPSNLKIADGYSADFPGGYKVRLKAISRGYEGPKELQYSVNERAWLPDGSPYYGEDLRRTGDVRFLGKDQEGVRCLSFDIASETDGDIEVYGYIPETAREGSTAPELHGRDVLSTIQSNYRWETHYRTPIVVEGHNATSYRFGLAGGPWKQIFSSSSIPAAPVDQEIGKGPWGRLVMEAPKKLGTYGGRMPAVRFLVEFAEPSEMSYRITLYDRDGNEMNHGVIRQRAFEAHVSKRALSTIGKIVVESRPISYIEFKNVHFDPDSRKWGSSYWGTEGESKIAKAPGVAQLEGLLRPRIDGQNWTPGEFFAPDGKAWREYPEPNNLRARFSTSEWPAGEPLVGILTLDPSLVANSQTVTVEAYVATSSTPGQGLGNKLPSLLPGKFEHNICQLPFVRPNTEYVQFKVEPSEESWHKEGETNPPSDPLIRYTPDQLRKMASGTKVIIDALTVCIRGKGSLDLFYHTADGKSELKEGLVRWPADGREIRLMARLKSGGRLQLYNNGASFSNNDPASSGPVYIFHLDKDGEPMLDSIKSEVALKDIEAFELESRVYGKPAYLVAKLPPKP